MNGLRLGLRQLRRDWRAGELTVLVMALIVAVASVSSVNFFTQRIQLALENQANDLLGGDLVYRNSNPIPAPRIDEAKALGLETATTVQFPTMVVANGASQLVALKAVSPAYPLRGQNHIAAQLFGPDRAVMGGPTPGAVWAESRLLTVLGLQVGDSINVGERQLVISAVLTSEPSQSDGGFFNVAPRLLMAEEDLPTTGLVQPASRIGYRLLLAGDSKAVERLYQRWQADLQPGESLRNIEDARPEVRTALERGRSFLGLAALVSVLLAGAAVAMAARRFVNRHLDSCAVMRCLGAEQRVISQIYLSQMVWLGLLASLVGVAIGYLGQWGLVAVLGPLAEIELPAPGAMPVLWGVLTGMVTLLGFAIPPILQLKDVPTLRVLRRDLAGVQPNALLAYGAGLGAFLLLAIIQANNLKLALMVVAGLFGVLLLLALIAVLLLKGLAPLQRRAGAAWRFALVNISRRANHSVVQMVGFGIGLMALLLLGVVRGDLLSEWEDRLPADTPNRFLINIQPAQVEAVAHFFTEHDIPQPQLYPMVRARLTAINGEALDNGGFDSERGRRLASREFNLSWAAEMQPDNKLLGGHWWQPQDHGKPWLSVEQGIAQELGLKLGDELRYNAGGLEFTARVTSLRSVEWDSFRANFFVLAPPGLLDDYPASYISAFYLSADRQVFLNRLVQQFPNITVLDVEAILNQVRNIIERVTLAVEYVFLFTLLAGLMVMFAAIHATLDERIHEAAILRTLGARRSQLLMSIIVEYAGLGLLSGLVAAIAAGAVGMVVAEQVFDLTYVPGPGLWLAGMLVGAIGIGVAGTLGTRFVINQPPLQVLRRM